MVFDVFHYYCYKKYHPDINQKSINELMPRILQTWKKRGIRPKCHLSEQQSGLPIGSHSVFVNVIPKELLEIPSKYNTEIDIMLEAKGKEFAIGKLYKKYPTLKPVFAKPLPNEIPKKALKDLNIKEPDDMANCLCEEK